MQNLEFSGRHFSGQTALDQGISDLMIADSGQGSFLYTTSGPMGGVTAFALDGVGAPSVADFAFFNASWANGAMSDLSLVPDGFGAQTLMVATDTSGDLVGFQLGGPGAIDDVVNLSPGSGMGGDLALDQWGSDMLFLSDSGQASILGYSMGPGDALQLEMSVADSGATYTQSVFAIETVDFGGQSFILGACQIEKGVSAYRIDAGGLSATGNMGSAEGLGIMTPTDMTVVDVNGRCYVLLASAPSDGQGQSGAISVLELASDGSLIPTDHIIDTLDTRFGGVQSLDVTSINGRTYVTAGGGDDGISVFVLMPNGRLVMFDSMADTHETGFENVSAIATTATGNSLRIFAASEQSAGLTELKLDVADTGITSTDVHTGGAGDDILIGSAEADVLSGGAGDDILEDGHGADTLTGGSGDDLFSLRADGSIDTITDFDWMRDRLDLSDWPFLYNPAGLTVTSTSTGAIVTWRNEVLEIYSHNGQSLTKAQIVSAVTASVNRPPNLAEIGAAATSQTLDGSPVGDGIDGGAGNDLIRGHNGHDTLIGGVGNDTIYGGVGDDHTDGGTDNDHVFGEDGHDTLRGGAGNDILDGGDGDDRLQGNDGNDVMRGRSGFDAVEGGGGNDWIDGGILADILDGNDGNDTILGGAGFDVISGGDGNDWIDGGTHADRLEGNDGDDTLFGGTGSNRLSGGNGHDHLNGGAGNDKLYGGAGNDVMDGGDGSNLMNGDSGDDLLSGGNGRDVSNGGSGSDTLNSGDGDDHSDGGTGHDLLDGGHGNDFLGGGGGRDEIWGRDGSDTLNGDGGFDTLYGGAGNDRLSGGTHADRLYGGDGNDFLDGGSGLNQLFGEDGNDTAQGGDGTDKIFGGLGHDRLMGSSGDDIIDGGADNDVLFGNDHNDTLFGGAGYDRLLGGSGSDFLDGGADDDELTGGGGFDTLDGGLGNDRLYGNFNADTFTFFDGHGVDTVQDFAADNIHEKIDLSRVSALNNLTDVLGPSGAAEQVGDNVRIDTGGGNFIWLLDVSIVDLDASDFLF